MFVVLLCNVDILIKVNMKKRMKRWNNYRLNLSYVVKNSSISWLVWTLVLSTTAIITVIISTSSKIATVIRNTRIRTTAIVIISWTKIINIIINWVKVINRSQLKGTKKATGWSCDTSEAGRICTRKTHAPTCIVIISSATSIITSNIPHSDTSTIGISDYACWANWQTWSWKSEIYRRNVAQDGSCKMFNSILRKKYLIQLAIHVSVDPLTDAGLHLWLRSIYWCQLIRFRWQLGLRDSYRHCVVFVLVQRVSSESLKKVKLEYRLQISPSPSGFLWSY